VYMPAQNNQDPDLIEEDDEDYLAEQAKKEAAKNLPKKPV